jgi:hypothetical protein
MSTPTEVATAALQQATEKQKKNSEIGELLTP